MMGKIKLNLVSGAVVEKPLINAFKANNSVYVVLDNEMNGSMGLPIILVCKFENEKLTKIIDQDEWSIVKEYLKNIIAGNQIEFVKLNNELVADDIYYTQLTLPVPSFDALKNAYKVDEVAVNAAPVIESPVQEVEPVIPNTPVVEPIQINPQPVMEPQVEIPVNEVSPSFNAEPVIDIPENPQPVEPTIPVASEITVEPVMPVQEMVSPAEIVPPISPVVENVTAQPVVEPSVEVTENVETSIFKEQKEAFMQACENMFDALVQKFERELENRK